MHVHYLITIRYVDYWLSQTFVSFTSSIFFLSFFSFSAEQQETVMTRSVTEPTGDSQRSSTVGSTKQAAPVQPTSLASQSTGTRTCTLIPTPDRTAGFALSGKTPPPYIICQIEKNSPAEKAGLLLNDALLSINGKSVTEKSYEDTVKLIKEALQQKSVELVVRDASASQFKDQERSKFGSLTSASEQGKSSLASADSNILGTNGSTGGGEPSRQGSNAVEEYQSM